MTHTVYPYPAEPEVFAVKHISKPLQLTSRRRRYVIILGILQIHIGVACIVLGSLANEWESPTGIFAAGIWGGIFMIICGVFGVVGGGTKIKSLLVTFVVLSVISALMAAVVFAMGVMGLKVGDCDTHYDHFDQDCKRGRIVDGLLVAFGILEIVIAIISVAVCSRPLCYPPDDDASVQYVKDPSGKIYVLKPEAAPATQKTMV